MNSAARVHEIRHIVHVRLPEDAPLMTTAFSKRRRPAALVLEYGLRRDVQRVDIMVEWRNGNREHCPPDVTLPEELRRLIAENRPADVDDPDPGRRTGMGGWDLPAPSVPEGDPRALHAMVVRGLRATGVSPGDAERYATAHQQDVLDRAGEAIDDEAWPHEKPESENRTLYRLADKVRGLLATKTA